MTEYVFLPSSTVSGSQLLKPLGFPVIRMINTSFVKEVIFGCHPRAGAGGPEDQPWDGRAGTLPPPDLRGEERLQVEPASGQ